MPKLIVDGKEIEVPAEYTLLQAAEAAGARHGLSEVFARGGEGGIEIAEAIVEAAEEDSGDALNFTYPDEAPIKEKIEKVGGKVVLE